MHGRKPSNAGMMDMVERGTLRKDKTASLRKCSVSAKRQLKICVKCEIFNSVVFKSQMRCLKVVKSVSVLSENAYCEKFLTAAGHAPGIARL